MITYKIIIAGSRSFNNYPELCAICNLALLRLPSDQIEIVSGRATGADKLGEQYAKANKYKLTTFPANWTKYGKAAGPIRNKEMADYANAIIAFWDGVSPGTKNMIKVAKSLNLQVYVHKFTRS